MNAPLRPPVRKTPAKAARARRQALVRSMAIAAPLAAVVALIAAGPSMLAAMGRPDDGGLAGGYDRLVNAIAQRQWLSVRYAADGEPTIGLRRDRVGQDARLRDFVNNSYLRSDFSDPSVWKLSDDGLWVEGIDPYAHRIERPLTDAGGWAGQIAFRGGGRGALRLVDVDRPDAAPLRLDPEGAAPATCDILMPTRRLAITERRRGVSLCLKDMANPPRAVGTLMLVGDRLLVRAQNRTPVEIRVGRRDARPAGEGEVAMTPVAPGETVQLRFDRAVLRLRLEADAADVSHVDADGGRVFYPGLRPIAEQLTRVLQTRGAAPVRLSLDAELQGVAQAALDGGAQIIRSTAAPGETPSAGDAFKGAVTVMDTTTGQVLAVASYPLREADLSPAQRRTRRGQGLLAQNHNFERLPIGSMAKAPFALSIIDADPGLATLKLAGGSDARFRTVLGMDLGKGGFDNHALGLTDFPTFLERSNNRYALALMMLAWRDPGGAEAAVHRQSGEPWSLEGRARTDAPPLPVYGDAAAPGPFGWTLQPPPGRGPVWPTRLAAIFDVGAAKTSGCRYDVAVWRGLAGPAPDCNSALASASPEREQLGFDSVASIRNDYLMSILGGGRSTWSAVKVAEVYSRIVTGRRVQARLTRVAPGAPQAPPLPLAHPQSRDLVLEGLRRVVRTGTAGWLGREFAGMGYGPEVELFGKTGTMKVAGEAPSDPAAVTLRQLARADCGLRWDARAGVLKFAAKAPRSQAEAARQVLALKETRCRVRIQDDAALAAQVAAEMARYACGFRGCQPTDFAPLPDGRVMAIAERPTEPPLLDGHAIAVVAIRNIPGQPPRGLTVVVNLQDKRQAESPALAVAAAILRSPAAKAWIEGRTA